MRAHTRRGAVLAALAATACLAWAGPAAAAATFQYVSETTAPSPDATTAEVTVLPTDTAADQRLQVLDTTGTVELYRSPTARHGTSLTWSGVPLAVGQVVRLLDGDDAPTATDTFRGPLLAADACVGATAFSGRAMARPRYSLAHAGPVDVESFAGGTFAQTLPAPLRSGDLLAVSADWTDPDGTVGASAQILTVTAACPRPPDPPAPPAPAPPPPSPPAPPVPDPPLDLGGSVMRVTALLGPGSGGGLLDGPAAGKLIWWRGTESTLGDWEFGVAGQRSTATTQDGKAVRVVTTSSVRPSDRIDLAWSLKGTGAHEERHLPVLGPTVMAGGCPGSTSVSGVSPRALGATDAAVTATLNGAPVAVGTDGDLFRVNLAAPLKDGDRLVLRTSTTWPSVRTLSLPLPAVQYRGIYTLAPGRGVSRVGCASTLSSVVGSGVVTVVGAIGGVLGGTSVLNVLDNGGVTVTLPSPGPGSFNLGLLFGGSDASRASAARRRHAVTVASAQARSARGDRRVRVKLRLTKAGRRLLRSARHSVRLRAKVTFDPATRGLPTVTKTKSTVLKLRRRP